MYLETEQPHQTAASCGKKKKKNHMNDFQGLFFFYPRCSIMHTILLWTFTMAADRLVRQFCGTFRRPWKKEKTARKKYCQHSSHSLVPRRQNCLTVLPGCMNRPRLLSYGGDTEHTGITWKKKTERHPELEHGSAGNIFGTGKSLI